MRTFAHRHAGLAFNAAETGSGPTFLFQHGLCGDAAQPADVFPGGSGWRCLTLECRGHGQSEAGDPEAFAIATFADDVASLIEAQNVGPVVIGGISMGAAIALRLAIRRPDLVRGLVLARPAWLWQAAPQNMTPNAVVGELLRHHSPPEARRLFEASDLARQLQREAPDNLASLLGFFMREPVAVTRELLCRISADGPGVSAAEVAALTVPTLVIGHARDVVHPLADAQKLASQIPSARLVEITPKAEDRERYRDEFQAALAAFLKELA